MKVVMPKIASSREVLSSEMTDPRPIEYPETESEAMTENMIPTRLIVHFRRFVQLRGHAGSLKDEGGQPSAKTTSAEVASARAPDHRPPK